MKRDCENDEIKKLRDSVRRDFGNRLSKLRSKNKLTQPEMMRVFVESTPDSISAYSKWENGQHDPSLIFLYQLRKIWGEDLNKLIAGDDAAAPTLPYDVQHAISVLERFKQDCLLGK